MRALLYLQILRQDIETEEKLPLILVYALYLHIEDRGRIDFDPGGLVNIIGEVFFISRLDLAPFIPEVFIVFQRKQLFQLIEICYPIIAYRVGDEA